MGGGHSQREAENRIRGRCGVTRSNAGVCRRPSRTHPATVTSGCHTPITSIPHACAGPFSALRLPSVQTSLCDLCSYVRTCMHVGSSAAAQVVQTPYRILRWTLLFYLDVHLTRQVVVCVHILATKTRYHGVIELTGAQFDRDGGNKSKIWWKHEQFCIFLKNI